jgi:hypothetical protein
VSAIAFLLIAVVVAVGGSLVVILRNQQAQSPDSAMDEFKREMQALAPQADSLESRRTTRFPFRPDDVDA